MLIIQSTKNTFFILFLLYYFLFDIKIIKPADKKMLKKKKHFTFYNNPYHISLNEIYA